MVQSQLRKLSSHDEHAVQAYEEYINELKNPKGQFSHLSEEKREELVVGVKDKINSIVNRKPVKTQSAQQNFYAHEGD